MKIPLLSLPNPCTWAEKTDNDDGCSLLLLTMNCWRIGRSPITTLNNQFVHNSTIKQQIIRIMWKRENWVFLEPFESLTLSHTFPPNGFTWKFPSINNGSHTLNTWRTRNFLLLAASEFVLIYQAYSPT